MKYTVKDTDRFWKKVDFEVDWRGCWIWKAGKNRDGYGRFYVNGKTELAHRVAFELTRWPLLEKDVLLHRCDNPACVHPYHLEAGTQGDNMRDRAAKGRARRW